MLRKQLSHYFMTRCDTKPIFVLGMQRSGTSMLTRVFHRHSQTLVVDEHKNNEAFEDYCLRDFGVIQNLISDCRFPYICFKPICDSHRITQLHEEFSDAHLIWLYRDFKDVANSYIRKFDSPTRAIQLVCSDRPGGGWFEEGLTPEILQVLKSVYRPTLTDFDLSCLVWWARNRIIIESGLVGLPNVTILRYETLVSDPTQILSWLFDRIETEYIDSVGHRISTRSIRKNASPEIDAQIRRLCNTTSNSLDDLFRSQGLSL